MVLPSSCCTHWWEHELRDSNAKIILQLINTHAITGLIGVDINLQLRLLCTFTYLLIRNILILHEKVKGHNCQFGSLFDVCFLGSMSVTVWSKWSFQRNRQLFSLIRRLIPLAVCYIKYRAKAMTWLTWMKTGNEERISPDCTKCKEKYTKPKPLKRHNS